MQSLYKLRPSTNLGSQKVAPVHRINYSLILTRAHCPDTRVMASFIETTYQVLNFCYCVESPRNWTLYQTRWCILLIQDVEGIWLYINWDCFTVLSDHLQDGCEEIIRFVGSFTWYNVSCSYIVMFVYGLLISAVLVCVFLYLFLIAVFISRWIEQLERFYPSRGTLQDVWLFSKLTCVWVF